LIKTGFYQQHSVRQQNQGSPFGTINFQNDTNNPLDAQFGYANAALGIFSSFTQTSRFIEGNWVYNNIEAFIQDNWKVTGRLTFDYGVRFVHQQPQYETAGQASNFFPDQWSLASAPLLYVPGCANGAQTCSGANRQAKNPATGQFLGPNSTLAIGALVPGSGNPTNGLLVAGRDIEETAYLWPALGLAPRFGLAWDISGQQRFVLRGGAGLFYDRPSGNSVFSQILNPPILENVTVRYGELQTLGSGGLSAAAPAPPSSLSVFEYDAKLPSSTQWNAGMQMELPWKIALDASYVGQHGFNIVQPVNINAVDYGAAFLAKNQDPTLAPSATPGASALSQDLMRSIRGYSAINRNLGWQRRTYHSIQVSFNAGE
jgi:hypothetical protein